MLHQPRCSSAGSAAAEFHCGPGSIDKFLAFVCSKEQALGMAQKQVWFSRQEFSSGFSDPKV